MNGPRSGVLPLDRWPEFALAPWRQSNGDIIVPKAEKRALGGYFAALRDRGLPLESTDRAVILDCLNRVQREHKSVPAIYANMSYLIGALTKIYPDENWEWLREWRLAWRRDAWPIKANANPENSRRWPRELQQAWRHNWPAAWPKWRDRLYRRAYGFFRAYCRTSGVEPDPTRDTLTAYADFLVARERRSARRELIRLYNALTVLFPDVEWSWLLDLERPLRSPRRERPPREAPEYSIPYRLWPSADQLRWSQALASPVNGSRLEHCRRRRNDRPASHASRKRSRGRVLKTPDHWRPATMRIAEESYASYLKAASNFGLKDRMPSETSVAQWIEALRQRGLAPRSLVNRAAGLQAAMRILHPDRDWAWLQRDIAILAEEARPTRDKLARIADVSDIRRAAIARMQRIDQVPLTAKAALAYQDGLVMLLLSYRPVRRRNLAETRLGINLIVDETFKVGRLCYPQTKTSARYEVPLPISVLHRLRKFLSIYRPLLAGPETTDAAWLSVNGQLLSANRLSQRIARATLEELGIRITPHLFRDCLATTVSEIAPENIEDAARLLGHHWPADKRVNHARVPSIETYRQRSGSTKASRELALLQAPYRIRPRPRRQNRSF